LRLAALSNERLSPWVNWSTLGPPLISRLAAHPGALSIAPPPFANGSALIDWLGSIRRLREADTLFWMQGSARPEAPIWTASFARGVARRSAFVVDAWPSALNKIGWLATIQRLNPCFVAFREAKRELTKRFPNGRFEWMPFGVDTGVFKPRDGERDIFIYWMGRRYEPLHQAIAVYCEKRRLKYVYTLRGGEIGDPEALGRLVSRSRYFVATPPNLDRPVKTGGFSPLTMRYMEGLAAGARLLGVLPASGEYEDLLPLDAILQVAPDGSDLAERLDEDLGDPTAAATTASAGEFVRANHSWERRAQQIFRRLASGDVSFPT